MKHTPGPWTYYPESDSSCSAIVAPGAFVCEFIESPNEANARLIAAAPDLLEALEDCLRVVEFLASDSCPTTIQNAKAALAKATGDQQ
jgi:hypothetical protein